MRMAFCGMIVFGAVASTNAAELPSRHGESAPRKAETCEIDGKPGYKLPGGDVCLRMTGYVSAQVSAGGPAK